MKQNQRLQQQSRSSSQPSEISFMAHEAIDLQQQGQDGEKPV